MIKLSFVKPLNDVFTNAAIGDCLKGAEDNVYIKTGPGESVKLVCNKFSIKQAGEKMLRDQMEATLVNLGRIVLEESC